jgi:cobalt/nickel transport system permease protein
MYARTVGSVFVRTYERGERVYLAMLSRVYTGSMPASGAVAVPAVQWVAAALLVGCAATVMLVARGLS